MNRIALMEVDSKYPNLALMKIGAYHKHQGDCVEWYNPFDTYDMLYMAKVFSFTPDYLHYINNAVHIERGGTGYDISKNLPSGIDLLQPDYSLYPQIDNKTAYGFLTRGCPNHCKWCVVPKKEGNISPYMDVEEIAIDGRNELILMDNNILASDYGLSQIEKIITLNEERKRKGQSLLRVDFNQGLDARLVTEDIAVLLAKLKWIKRIRFGCDTPQQIQECDRATTLIDKYGYKGEYFFYCILLDNFKEAFVRINHWRNKGGRFLPHAQPYRHLEAKYQIIPQCKKIWLDGLIKNRFSEPANLEILVHERDLGATNTITIYKIYGKSKM